MALVVRAYAQPIYLYNNITISAPPAWRHTYTHTYYIYDYKTAVYVTQSCKHCNSRRASAREFDLYVLTHRNGEDISSQPQIAAAVHSEWT